PGNSASATTGTLLQVAQDLSKYLPLEELLFLLLLLQELQFPLVLLQFLALVDQRYFFCATSALLLQILQTSDHLRVTPRTVDSGCGRRNFRS
uniref:hypothetical protein n=1 Tax=Anaplasma phagocytophilum TaxID=948 RepID=UPI0005F95876